MLGDLNEKMQEISRSLVELQVNNVLNKNKDKMKMKQLSDEEKENLRNLFQELEAQVNEFINNARQQGTNSGSETMSMENVNTSILDRLRKKK